MKKNGSEFKAKQCSGIVLLFILFMLYSSSGKCTLLLVTKSLLSDQSCVSGVKTVCLMTSHFGPQSGANPFSRFVNQFREYKCQTLSL